MRRLVARQVMTCVPGRGAWIGSGGPARAVRISFDQDAGIDRSTGTITGGVIYRRGGGKFAHLRGPLAVAPGSGMQAIDRNGDGRDDLTLAGRGPS